FRSLLVLTSVLIPLRQRAVLLGQGPGFLHLRIPYPLRGRAELGLLDASTPPRQVLTGQLLPGTHLPQVRGQRGEERFDRHVLQAIPAIPVVAVEGRACGHDRVHHYPPPFALPRGRSRPSVVVSGGLL